MPAPKVATGQLTGNSARSAVDGGVLADSAGRLWVQKYDERTAWVALNSDGTKFGQLTLKGVRELPTLMSVQRNAVVVSWIDEDGAARVAHIGSTSSRTADSHERQSQRYEQC